MIVLYRSGAVRLAALFLVLLITAVVAAFAATYWIVRAETLARMRADLVARADRIAARSETEPPETALADPGRQGVAALFGADGSRVAGSKGLSAFRGWEKLPAASIDLNESGEETSDEVLAFGRRIGDRTLVVGQGMRDLEDTGETLLDGLLGSLAIVVVVGCAGAVLIAWRVDRRLRHTEEALNAYGLGDTSRRLPLVGL